MTSQSAPIEPQDLTIDGPNQLWVADITYVAVVDRPRLRRGVSFSTLGSRRGRSAIRISRSIDFRLTLAALNAAIDEPQSRSSAALRFSQPLGSRFAICLLKPTGSVASLRSCFGSMEQIRGGGILIDNRQGRELHEDPQGLDQPSIGNGLRRLRRCSPRTFRRSPRRPVLRTRRRRSMLRPGLSHPATVRGSQPPAHSQFGGLIPVRPNGPTPIGGQFWTR